ncbi:MAG: DNA-directed RNA polymerase, subunit E'' [Candidatus Diapherotrites archaeon]|nr:DNA-directed RNA polymerase, subunit E'' [Candidatus Diapherotrites archaeon]
MMQKEKACRNCRRVIEKGSECPSCGSTSFTTFWRGYVLVIDPEKSEIAKRMQINSAGKYALRISR